MCNRAKNKKINILNRTEKVKTLLKFTIHRQKNIENLEFSFITVRNLNCWIITWDKLIKFERFKIGKDR